MRKSNLVIVAAILTLIVVCTGVVAYMSVESTLPGPMLGSMYEIKGIEFIDDGSGNDTIIVTTLNWSDKTITITDGYVAQRAWVVDGKMQNREHPFVVELLEDSTIPSKTTKEIRLSLAKDTLIAGKEYTVGLTTAPKNIANRSFFSATKRFVFYHMYHPNAAGPVEEGVINNLYILAVNLTAHDNISAWIKNTGDTTITIEGGFANGMAAQILDASEGPIFLENCIIAPNASGHVDLRFKKDSYILEQYENDIPFNVKLITSEGNIEYPDKFYVFWGRPFHEEWTNLPVVSDEKAEISNVKFDDLGGTATVSMSVHNTGDNLIRITGAMLDGKGATTELLDYSIEVGATRTITFPFYYDLPAEGSEYRLVLISSQNNAFIYTSTMT